MNRESVASIPGQLLVVEHHARTAFYHWLKDVASWIASSGDLILGEQFISIIYIVIVPGGQGTIILHTVQVHKPRLLLHKQFLNLNVKIRQHVNIRNVLGKHKEAASMLWAKEHAEGQVPWLSQHRWMIHRHWTWRICLKEGSIVTLRIFTDTLFPTWSARQTVLSSSLHFDNWISV